MTTTNTPREIAAGFALAGLTLCLGMYFSMEAGEYGGDTIFRLFEAVAVLIVLRVTGAWGRRRGFPARKEDGHIVILNVLRNLVMSAIMCGVLLLVFAPLFMIAFRFAR